MRCGLRQPHAQCGLRQPHAQCGLRQPPQGGDHLVSAIRQKQPLVAGTLEEQNLKTAKANQTSDQNMTVTRFVRTKMALEEEDLQ
ncbi:hypothetical protein scyTo_0025224 [Scyliorhinus torazame]|uniref:Uncharacterized protein n=1 Tax=Scyliorhinus torazame TaxID=75743 RepID=A0A401QGL6_SCYTO|nr:hypothetical protein [Scyliorhinus torazame]